MKKSTFQDAGETAQMRPVAEPARHGAASATAWIVNSARVAVQARTLQALGMPVPAQCKVDDETEDPLRAAHSDRHGGLPGPLRAGMEALSGVDLSHVRVHRNSSQPAQLNALAYAQGNDIHLGPGQERHLPHEAWHVVQQAQSRVNPTLRTAGGVAVNDDRSLEREADVMGERALQRQSRQGDARSDGRGTRAIRQEHAPIAARNPNDRTAQRVAKVDQDFLGGKAILYTPDASTTRAAYYAHGTFSDFIHAVGGVNLGYLCPPNATVSTNAGSVVASATHGADSGAPPGKWHSYALTIEAGSENAEWASYAEDSQRAIAYVVQPMTTAEIVSALVALGYTEILAVHCREVEGQDNVDWDPETGQVIQRDAEITIARSALTGWLDACGDALDAVSPLTAGDRYLNQRLQESYEVIEQTGETVRLKFMP